MRPAAVIFAMMAVTAAAEIIDRIAVAVEHSVITESELLRQIRITALMNGTEPAFTPDVKRETADRLVEQALIRREISASRYGGASDARASKMYKEFRARWKTDASYAQALARYAVTDEEVREAFRWQGTLLEFVEVRFRPGIQISEAEMRDYYESTFVPKMQGRPVPFAEVRDDIESILTQERVDNALDRWLGQTRTQSRIRYMEEVFR